MIVLFLAMSIAAAPEPSAPTRSDDDLLTLAEQEYAKGLEERSDATRARPHFRTSASAFEELWARGHRSTVLARNLAQAYLLAGDLAQAIRAYHLGLRLLVYDPELREGLNFARTQVQFPTHGSLVQEARARDRRSFLRHGPVWLFAAVAVGIYLFSCLAIARGWMSRRPIWFVLGAVLFIFAVLATGAVLWENRHLEDERALSIAIVNQSGAMLHRGNGKEFPLRLPERLPEGVELVVLSERGGWLQVQLGGGAVGWVEADRVARVE